MAERRKLLIHPLKLGGWTALWLFLIPFAFTRLKKEDTSHLQVGQGATVCCGAEMYEQNENLS